eukprot:CAMPEP_0115090494 /NCGR_PEP_ID=MMETSP0227-20121206/25462_1 /TAXON_ID=89957 /ORGANISM="Polarella glacialis, Strain CCMP 1383" /LENGTH=282 /DNA_ID=CAMNT_0002481649 /DNA_START=1 /DNA_END=852 /DNA_ORIENTATION=+
MFFMNKGDGEGGKAKGRGSDSSEQLAISALSAELKVMSAVETKSPGTFTRNVREKLSSEEGFATDRIIFKDDELSYALGKEGSTRKKLEIASGAVCQYVGHVAFIAGELKDRKRCKQFIDWLLAQRRGSVTVADVQDRDDCTEMHIPESCKGWVTGNRGSELRRVEMQSKTFIFMALDGSGEERLLIFCANPGSKSAEGGRMHAERLINDMVQDKLRDNPGAAAAATPAAAAAPTRAAEETAAETTGEEATRERGAAALAAPPTALALPPEALAVTAKALAL